MKAEPIGRNILAIGADGLISIRCPRKSGKGGCGVADLFWPRHRTDKLRDAQENAWIDGLNPRQADALKVDLFLTG